MTDNLVFMMGEYEALVPGDRFYAWNHLWLQEDGDALKVGLTSYAVRLLQDVFFLDWTIDANTDVSARQEIGEIESSKAVSSLYAPEDGHVLNFNDAPLDDPSAVNTSGYDQGWLYRFRTEAELLSPGDYLDVLNDGWEDTQRMIKGQLN
jgi:glycine cleavage system H protein